MNNLAIQSEEIKSTAKAHILIVDDEEPVRTLLKRILEREGYACETAEDAQKAAALMLIHKFNLVISDVKMPGKSGIQFLEEIKTKRPEVATLIMTGLGDKQIADAAIEKGSYGFLHKPFQKTQVLATVAHALKCRSMDLQNQFEVENLEAIIKDQEQCLDQANIKLKNILQSIIKAMSMAIESRDPYTAGHQQRVANLAAAIASEMGYAEEDIQNLKMACLIHDIGKISVPAEILCKPGKLSAAEFNIIKDHARIGYTILKEIEFPYPLAQVIYQHHERMDGSGYPQGLKGDEIHPHAKILAVADVVEAMISHRPYRPGIEMDLVLEEIQLEKGQLYDPKVVDVCVRIIKTTNGKFFNNHFSNP